MTTEAFQFMRLAIRLARDNVNTTNGGPFGAVIVQGTRVVASASNQVVPSCDPTAHAEIVAIRQAAAALGTHELRGCTIFSSTEPCPMCLSAIHWARIDAIWFAASRDDAAAAGFDDLWLYQEVCKPLSERLLPTSQILSEEGLEPFLLWQSKIDKIPY